MISFDDKGNPIPIGMNLISIDEFKAIFVFSDTRGKIFVKYIKYVSEFQQELIKEFTQWIGGSFTTRKENPSDIDLVNHLKFTEELNKKQHILLRFLTVGGSKISFNVDGYFIPIYPDTDPRFAITEYWLNHWKNFFGHDRLNNPKGIIEISVN